LNLHNTKLLKLYLHYLYHHHLYHLTTTLHGDPSPYPRNPSASPQLLRGEMPGVQQVFTGSEPEGAETRLEIHCPHCYPIHFFRSLQSHFPDLLPRILLTSFLSSYLSFLFPSPLFRIITHCAHCRCTSSAPAMMQTAPGSRRSGTPNCPL
jgi:hypothetical protein